MGMWRRCILVSALALSASCFAPQELPDGVVRGEVIRASLSSNVTRAGYCIVRTWDQGEWGDTFLARLEGTKLKPLKVVVRNSFQARNTDELVEHEDELHFLFGNDVLSYDFYKINREDYSVTEGGELLYAQPSIAVGTSLHRIGDQTLSLIISESNEVVFATVTREDGVLKLSLQADVYGTWELADGRLLMNMTLEGQSEPSLFAVSAEDMDADMDWQRFKVTVDPKDFVAFAN